MAGKTKKAKKFVIRKGVFIYGGKKKDYERGDFYLLPTEIMKHLDEVEKIELSLGTKTYKTTLAWARSNWRPDANGWLVPKSIFKDEKKRATK